MTHKSWQKIACFVLLLAPFLLYLIDVDWLNEQHSVCLFQNIFGVKCWGCGITRAVLSVLHLDFAAAWQYNELVVIVFPLLAYLWLRALVRLFKKIFVLLQHKNETK
ncbi:MAG: DUF2752 domain-containing protein [Bacteroidales bacterium]|jgi:hypothetical protein|nr:DUF2752 domain-containing protein [Bacteroidales bacterium]